jgi:hypothetical protein
MMALSRHLPERTEKNLMTASLLSEIWICNVLTKQECYDLNAKFSKMITNDLDVDRAIDFHCPETAAFFDTRKSEVCHLFW